MMAMASTTVLDALVALFCLSCSAILYSISRNSKSKYPCWPQGYVLENQVTHARLLPAKSSHAFTYPTISLFVSLAALEKHTLDLWNGWIFGYGNKWGRLVGLRPDPYLTSQDDGRTIGEKIQTVLEERGYMLGQDASKDVWMMTMPSLLGFEGINPLTVYFIYKAGAFWLAVLEIHNTFGETHIHILQVGKDEDDHRPQGFTHQWTFYREFHVSPFNDRSGFYTVSIREPSRSTLPPHANLNESPAPPKPAIRIHLHTASTDQASSTSPTLGPLKLTASLRPVTARPLTTFNLLQSLTCAPFALFLSMPRILYEAWILHYIKRLDVYIRPEPKPTASSEDWGTGSNFSARGITKSAGGLKWIKEGPLEAYARQRMIAFLRKRLQEVNATVTLLSSDPEVPQMTLSSDLDAQSLDLLVVSFLSPRFFTLMLLCPSAAHALLSGSDAEGLFFVSSRELFCLVFSSSTSLSQPQRPSYLQNLRSRPIPVSITLPIPPGHFLDDDRGSGSFLLNAAFVWTSFALEILEESIFRLARARPVEGEEPWKQWDRAAAVFRNGGPIPKTRHTEGSVRRVKR